jgi:Spy/CpxP family protein refolding chaperone
MLGKMTILAAGLALLAAVPAAAHGMGGGPPMGGDGPMPIMMLLHNANLTSEQQDQIHTIMHSNHQQMESLFQQLHSIDQQVSAKLLGSTAVTASDFTALEQQKAQIQQQIDQNMINTALQIRGVLTATQLSTAASTNAQLESLHQQIEQLLNPNGSNPPPPPGN